MSSSTTYPRTVLVLDAAGLGLFTAAGTLRRGWGVPVAKEV